MLQNTRLQGNGCRSPRSDDNMNDSFEKILYMRKTVIMKCSTLFVCLFVCLFFCFTHDHENFEMCGVLNSSNGL